MSLLKKLAGLAVGAAAVGAVAYVLQNREHHDDEYEHIWGPEDEVEPETDSAEPAADDASAEAEPAPAAAPEEPAAPAEEPKPEEPADAAETPAAMLMYGKEASNRKQEIDRQHYTIPNQRPKDKHCGKI